MLPSFQLRFIVVYEVFRHGQPELHDLARLISFTGTGAAISAPQRLDAATCSCVRSTSFFARERRGGIPCPGKAFPAFEMLSKAPSACFHGEAKVTVALPVLARSTWACCSGKLTAIAVQYNAVCA